MNKKKKSQEDNQPIDYFKAIESTEKSEKPETVNVISSLRADMLPASRIQPMRRNIFQRIGFKFFLGFLICLLILGAAWYLILGPGRSPLEQRLVALVHLRATATFTSAPTKIMSTSTPLQLTKTPKATTRPTATIAMGLLATETLVPVTATQTGSSDCRDASTITLDDLGKTLCTRGVLLRTIKKPTYFIMAFSNADGSFYWVAYDLIWSTAEVGTCYQVTGKILQLGNNPVLVFTYKNLPEVCP